jgi:hypothetical protein
MPDLLGIHWIVTTHGTWLHGDPRGSWYDGKLIGRDPFLEDAVRARMAVDAVCLTDDEREIVAGTFGETIMERRWRVGAATIRPMHAHVVFHVMVEPIKQVIATLKYRSARAMWTARRKLGRKTPRSLWTEGQFPVFLTDAAHWENAIAYVRSNNLRCGLPADPYAWIG